MKANGASRNMTSIGLVMLMLTSLLLAGVVAEVADGNGTTGIDRNPNPQEQDLIKPTRTYHPESTHSLLSLDVANGYTEFFSDFIYDIRVNHLVVSLQYFLLGFL